MTSTELVRRGTGLPEKLEYAEKLAQAGLLPDAYRRQPANVLYAIEYGEMLNLPAMAAINGIHVIKGKPTASAALIASLVRRAGHRLRVGYDAKTRTGWAEIVRSDDPDFTFRAEWDLERAVAANLCQIKDGQVRARDKDNKPTPWELYTPNMQKHRALTECARDACEEALNGVHYTPEELGAPVDAEGDPIHVVAERADAPAAAPKPKPAEIDWDAKLAAAAGNVEALKDLYMLAKGMAPNDLELGERIAAAGKAAKAAAEAAAEAPVVLEAELVEEDQTTAGEMANERQLTAIAAALGEHGVKDRDHRLAVISLLIGDRIASMKDLMHVEATLVLDTIGKLAAAGTFDQTSTAALASLQNDAPA